jgi:hypothetical protein
MPPHLRVAFDFQIRTVPVMGYAKMKNAGQKIKLADTITVFPAETDLKVKKAHTICLIRPL